MDEAEVYEFLRPVLRSVFGRDIEPTPVLTAADVVGWDSLKQVEITLALEEEYGVRIRTKELNNVANVGDLVKLVVTKANA
jgi:acyl carrier protein